MLDAKSNTADDIKSTLPVYGGKSGLRDLWPYLKNDSSISTQIGTGRGWGGDLFW
jgi:hypothetical protein